LETALHKEVEAVARFQIIAVRLDLREHHRREPGLRAIADLRAVKTWRRDAADSEVAAVDDHIFADRLWVACEAFLPTIVSDHRDWMRAGRFVVGGREEASQRGLNAQ